jgi:coenzyme F420-reducing hydrogenase beta subunit
MSTIKGVKNRLRAAGSALTGDYTVGDNKKPEKPMNKSCRVNAARRALNGEYILRDNKKPVVCLDPVEIKLNKVYTTKTAAEAAAKDDQKKLREVQRQTELQEWRRESVKNNDDKTVGCIDPDYCSGCGACFSVCPAKAISMDYDSEGFLAPVVDYDKCTGCGLCRKICPSINLEYKNTTSPTCYAAYADNDIRAKSSSGGIFTLLAEYAFERGGVVCGAGYTEDFKVEHFIIEKPEDLDRIRKSKYVQSDASKVYADIKRILKEGRVVLFCGCGCQVAGLYATLKGVNLDNLYTIDLMCHGSPSPKVFEHYLDTYHGRKEGKIADVDFRDKSHFGWAAGMTVKYKDGTVYYGTKTSDAFYRAFNPCMSMRKFCGHCAYAKLPRKGDITLADFWGASKYNKEYSDGKGTSIVAVNSTQGEKLYKAVGTRLKLSEEISLDYLLGTAQPFDHYHKCHPARQRYFEQLECGATLDKAYDYAVNNKYDVGIYGVWFGTNYGSVATYYALHQIVRSFGLTVLMIDKPGSGNDVEVKSNHARRFSNEHYHISKIYPVRELKKLNSIVDTFIIGSDQVWNRGISKNFGYSFYFDFVEPDKKKIAFAASFGHGKDFCNVHDRETISAYMHRFDGIGIRETSGVDICKNVYNVDAIRVLDPVFVAERREFDALADQAKKKHEGKYMLAYILDPTPEKRAAVVEVSEKLGLDIVVLLDGRPKDPKKNRQIMDMDDKIVDNIAVEDWLNFFRNAEFVITDSCHGISFSLVFERNFIGLANTSRGLTRFESLVDVFQVRDHYVREATEILGNDELLKPVDYEKVNKILVSERARSLEWLKNMLFSPKKFDGYRAYPIVDNRLAKEEEE